MEEDPEPFEIFGFIVDEEDPLGGAIAEILDIPWYVALFWISIGGLSVFMVLFILLIVWNS